MLISPPNQVQQSETRSLPGMRTLESVRLMLGDRICSMRYQGLEAFLVLSAFAGAALGQTGTGIPSKDEISELLSKANEKVSTCEAAVKSVKADLDKVDPKLAANYFDAASTAHLLIEKTRQGG